MRREDKLYQEDFGHIPDDQKGRIQMIMGKYYDNKKYTDKLEIEVKKFKRVKYDRIQFTMWKVVKPSMRPRANARAGFIRMYVPGAKESGDWFAEFAKENNLPHINTPCIFNLKVYQKTPNSFSIKNKVLAEMGLLRPWNNTGDFDNYAKTVADAIQHGMLSNDSLIFSSKIDRFYSIKPHAEVEIIYMKKFPEY